MVLHLLLFSFGMVKFSSMAASSGALVFFSSNSLFWVDSFVLWEIGEWGFFCFLFWFSFLV
jgi:hypothetical protein